jgi:hypothetical protein
MANIAFIGLGNMGGPMARNLLKAGHEVRGFDLSPAALEAFAAAGADCLYAPGISTREQIAKVVAAETSFPDRFARVVDILRRIGAAGGFAAADTLIASVYAEGGQEPLLIPHEQASGGGPRVLGRDPGLRSLDGSLSRKLLILQLGLGLGNLRLGGVQGGLLIAVFEAPDQLAFLHEFTLFDGEFGKRSTDDRADVDEVARDVCVVSFGMRLAEGVAAHARISRVGEDGDDDDGDEEAARAAF